MGLTLSITAHDLELFNNLVYGDGEEIEWNLGNGFTVRFVRGD